MHVGIDSFVAAVTDPGTGRQIGPEERLADLLEEIETADRVGLYSFGIGEHHRPEYYDSAPPVILAAAAARTERIRLGSAVAVLSAADADPDRQRVLQRPRVHPLAGQGGAVPAGPGHALGLADAQQQVELFLEQLVVVGQREPEERKRLGERPAAHHEVDPPARQQVEGRELLEHPHRIGRAQDGDGAVQADPLRAGGRGGQDHRRRGVVVLGPVVLADAEGVEAGPIGGLDLLEQVGHPLRGPDLPPRGRIGHRRDEAVDAQVHGVLRVAVTHPTVVKRSTRSQPPCRLSCRSRCGRRTARGRR